jgi:adenylylsulfate reductase subunit B
MRAYNQEPDACWECYSCVKICPQGAIAVRGYNDFVPMGGMVHPMRSADSIMWTIKFRNGNLKRFKFPIRTTAECAANAYEGQTAGGSLDDENLFMEKALPTPKK